MNLYKVYAALVIFLSVCTYDAEGGIILLLLLKIIALKGALFFGVPLALGSFMLGQGMGFFGGTIFGGFGVLHAAHKYLNRPKHVAHHVIQKPVHVYHGPPKFPSNGWGWQTTPAVHGVHVYKYHARPTIWNKISSIPGILTSRYRKRPPAPFGQGWSSSPGWTKAPTTTHGQNPLNTYYETLDSDKHQHYATTGSSNSQSTIDWQNLLRQAELEAEQKYNGQSSSYGAHDDNTYSQSPSYEKPSYSSYSSSTSDPEYLQDGGYESSSYSSGLKYESPSDGYSSSGSKYESPTYSSASSSSGGYGSSDTHYDSSPSSQGYSSSKYEGYKDPYSYDGQGLESSEFYKKIPAPNSVLEKFLEQKLEDEIKTQKSESKKRDAAQLIQMLRQVYMQELATSMDTPASDKISRAINTVSSVPAFKPFPSVPNSTTAKPTEDKNKIAAASTASPSLAPPPTTANLNPLLIAAAAKFIPMGTSFTFNRRMGQLIPEPDVAMTPPSFRAKRQSLPVPTDLTSAQALATFADDVKKFFLLVSLLDQDRCLQKLVCDVHTKGTDATLTPYESNIVITFKVMNAILPLNVEDSTTNYRKAAKIGELSKNMAVCSKAYPTCTYSTDQIINMGNQANAEALANAESTTQSSSASADMEASASEDQARNAQVPIVTPSPTPATAMPRV